jgi:branched-subunit amino acid transport protein
MDSAELIVATVVLAAGTFAFRFAGPVLRARVTLSPRAEKLTSMAAVVLLAALVAIWTFTQGGGFAGYARPAGVLAGGVLAWCKAPFVAIVLVAAATTALLRLAGVP